MEACVTQEDVHDENAREHVEKGNQGVEDDDDAFFDVPINFEEDNEEDVE